MGGLKSSILKIKVMPFNSPPKLALKILKWFSDGADLEDIIGDMEELYFDQAESNSSFVAGLLFWKHTFSVITSYALRKRKRNASYSPFFYQNSITMIKNYFKIAIRNFSKHKFFTSLNIIGLALGMSVSLLALSISVAIYRSDDFHEKKDRVYQINTYVDKGDEDRTFGSTYHAVGYHIKERFPFVEDVLKIKSGFKPTVDHFGNNIGFHGYFSDESFFNVFSFNLVEGDPKTALEKPFSIVLTQSVAEKLYRDDNPIGKTLETDFGTFTITGVMEDLKQTHFYFEVLTSFSTYEQLQDKLDLKNDWVNYRNNYVYVLLNQNTSENIFAESLPQMSQFVDSFHPEKTVELEIVALDEVVPRWNISNAIGIGWDVPSMLLFMFIGLLVLLPAIFNYINLSLARAIKRAKEVGIRKVVGAEKGHIRAQFIVETVLLALFALAGGVMIFIPMKEQFLEVVAAAEVLDTSFNLSQVTALILFALMLGLITGYFPAKFFSRLNPLLIMKGSISQGKVSISGLKKGLVVFQFFLSLVFIIGIATMARQYSYVLSANLGFEKENVLTVPFEGIDKQVALNELGKHPDVNSITATSSLPGVMVSEVNMATSNDIDTFQINQVFIGDQFVDMMKMRLKWEDGVSIEQSNNSLEMVIVNQEFLDQVGVFNTQKDSLLFTLESGKKCRVVGILEDLYFEPLSEVVSPLILRHSLDKSNHALLSIKSDNVKQTIGELEMIWSSINQDVKFQSAFLDDEIADAYYFLEVQMKFFTYLSVLAITISCLGLLGMVSYSTENRIKEIAIRKILGASPKNLYYLLTKDFAYLILLSALIAIPFSYFFYDKLFLYFLIRHGLGLGVLEVVCGILFLFLVGFISIYWQASRVTRENPAGNLRYE